jgi:hypothetical protein
MSNESLRLKALQVSIGRILRNEVVPHASNVSRGYRRSMFVPLYLNDARATWNRWNALNNQIKRMKKRAPIVNRLLAKNKERMNHWETRNKESSTRTKNWFNKQLRINRELAKMENDLLFGVRALNKFKSLKAAAAARGRTIGRAAKNSFEYRPTAPKIGNFGGRHYRNIKYEFNKRTGRVANVGTSPRRNISPKGVSPKRGMKHAKV